MPRPYRSNPKIKRQAIEHRKESTPAERKLWAWLRNDQVGISFRRQHAIGPYIPDFCSPKAKFIIELDGSQHLEQEDCDDERTKLLLMFPGIRETPNSIWCVGCYNFKKAIYK